MTEENELKHHNHQPMKIEIKMVEDGASASKSGGNESKILLNVGMCFDTLDAFFSHYKQYGKQEGFGVKKTASRNSPCGKLKHITLSCSRAGKSEVSKPNFLNPNPQTKVGCQARINATMMEDGKCRINSILLEHNHGLSPQKARFYLCNREINIGAQRKLELNDQAGICVSKNFQSFVVEAGGHNKVPFLERDCRNYVDKARRLRLGVGDAKAIHDYFMKMQAKSSNFFYMMDVDDDARIKNLFWADARSRAVYEEFSDVITFETTYLTNKYEMPFAPFVGVNHHGQSVLLGCGLLSNEDAATFTWLFKTWLQCMYGRAPNAIITDQDKAMQKAIPIVFPTTRHRWCLWHIMKKIPEKLSRFSSYEEIKKVMQNVIYNSLTKKEFEERWGHFVDRFNLFDNAWLSNLYDERHRWIPAFVKDTFWAGMSTTQRSESMNSFFDGYVNSKTSLKQFVEQYDNALRDKIEKEDEADFKSFNSLVPCVTHFEIEKQFQIVYTNYKFKEFQKEVTGKLYCDTSYDASGVYNVVEDVFVEEKSMQVHYKVWFDKEKFDVHCDCRMFEFKGILCKHILSVLVKNQIKQVPEKYILSRWRKDLKRRHSRIKVSYDKWFGNPETKRYDKLQEKFDEAANMAVVSDESCEMLWRILDDFQRNTHGFQTNLKSSTTAIGDHSKISTDVSLKSPMLVQRHGRPPHKRKCSIVEKKVLGKKKRHDKNIKKREISKVLNFDGSSPVADMNANNIGSSSVSTDMRIEDHVNSKEQYSRVARDNSNHIDSIEFQQPDEASTRRS